MKKRLLSVLLTLLVTGMCTSFQCTHIHTEKCGEDRENCTHECIGGVKPYEKEKPNV